ncbi:MAG: sigma-70 family RNA polymerase sigma factor [candidate division Zixibacteria bacterium]|nr:sigma-70 family RNA polymerase sigma factor [candidate division Zixibacteria bacterium]
MVEKKFKTGAEETEDKLIARAKKGDIYSFERLVERYQKKFYYLALRMTRSHEAADDLAQESFIKAFYSLKSFKEGHSFCAWVYKICMNLTINYLKRQKFTISESQLPQGSLELVEDTGKADASEQLVRDELARKIENEIDHLPAEFRAVFILKTYEELSYEEIANTLKISKGTVMSRLFRARERLQKSLKGYL